MEWLKEIKFLEIIDFDYLSTKIIIWLFSAVVSIAPITFMGLKRISKLDFTYIRDYILSSEDVIYSLVTLSTIVLADVLHDITMKHEKRSKWIFIYCLAHILMILFGTLIYAYYKTETLKSNDMMRVNKIFLWIVAILSLLSYINIAIGSINSRKE